MSSIKKIFKTMLAAILLLVIFLLGLQFYFYLFTKNQVTENLDEIPQSDYVVVLGCGVIGQKPTPMLKKRLETGLDLLNNNKAKKVILSGYKDGDYYDEVSVMKTYMMDHGVAEKNIIEDKKGDNTYYSVKNLENYENSSFVLVTQEWHLKRALYLANKLNEKNVYGLIADSCQSQSYTFYMNFREVFARVKAVLDVYGLHME